MAQEVLCDLVLAWMLVSSYTILPLAFSISATLFFLQLFELTNFFLTLDT